MRDFLLIFKALYRDSISRKPDEGGKRQISSGIKLVLTFAPLLLMLCALMGFLSAGLKDEYELSLVLVAIVGGSAAYDLVFKPVLHCHNPV